MLQVSVDTLQWEFSVLTISDANITGPPKVRWPPLQPLSVSYVSIKQVCSEHDLLQFQFSVSVSVSAQDGIVALGKAHTRSAPSLSSLPKVALETVPIFVWLNTDRSRPWRVECRPLPFSTPLSFRRSVL